MELSKEQELSIQKFKEGKNIFITGEAGTGKTEIIKNIKQIAEEQKKTIQTCALTGCAAVLLGGKAKTIHSWAGIGLGNAPIETIIKKIRKFLPKLLNWIKIDILVIDEVSMMSKKLFELLDSIGKTLRRNTLPFGGIQLIFSGDFYQLSSVGSDPDSSMFCFESPLWNETFLLENHIQLKQNFRQNDIIFQTILNEIRVGKISKTSRKILSQQMNKDSSLLEIKPTRLYPIKSKVDFINKTELNKLTTEEFTFEIKRISSVNNVQTEYELNNIQNNLLCDKLIKLRVGAQVMCIVNMTLSSGELLCNGSQGIITQFKNGIPVVKFTNGNEICMDYHMWQSETMMGVGIAQIPLILSYAITIHKSQGMSLDFVELDIGSDIFGCGQSYVALSRVKSLEGYVLLTHKIIYIIKCI
jgi:ATP-dependent DNA helicase PIF1